ncbi:restriction endonuclease subunit M, partial [Algoriphagus lacus]
MALFQSSVLKKYLAAQEHRPIHEAFAAYLTYFHNPRIRENIRASKEEQFQEGFLRELFVKIFGYTINPEPDYNLTTELKNIRDSKKTDGAILKDGNALAVIELKGTDTKDLDKIRDQAFNYKNNQPECVYVITSNFEKLRFYIDNAVDYVEFNILAMESDQFKLMWLLLHRDNLLSGLPKKIKEESLLAEEQITKQLYRDYSNFKQELWQDLVAQNPGQDELVLYKKSQKLLDRFLFIFFAEDKGLLPPNSISEIVKHWKTLEHLDAYAPLYDRFKLYFGFLNTGRPAKGDKAEIHAYNGGLFAPDPILDTLTISDSLLEKHVRKLTEYDFESEVDTNILGHIFEHSLNDIENVRAQLAGQEVDKSKTKRKRDGVFYTPKYITKYIVDNTLGRLCTEKKADLQLVDEEFSKYLSYKTKEAERKRKTELKQKLDTYRNWLLQLTICDPACGSGAFLNQVLEFLIAEHRYVDELEAQLFDTPLVLPNVENHILENNIFGVDINEESVEIARLSLWLRTAKKGRKLSSLNSNIKVGNSLIDDPAVAGDLAFDWQAQFPQVFAKGGFDVVVGNPPYVDIKALDPELVKILFQIYKTAENRINLYSIFIEKGYYILKDKGFLSFINPNSILVNSSYTKIRKMLIDDMTTIVKLPDNV